MCGICTCKHVDMYISCVLCFQSGGGGTTSSSGVQQPTQVEMVVSGHHQIHGTWEMEIVSKISV